MNPKVKKRIWRKGSATVEAAILFPVLLLLTFGIIEYGWLFLNANLITNTARHGARIAILPNSTNTLVTNSISNLMATANITGYQVTISPSDISSMNVGEVVKVEISVPWRKIAIINSPFLPKPTTNLRASVSMAKEGP
jgi:Flp pilus assembly protein TadG